MQVRKLIRLLNELVEKDPSAAYKEACIDTRYGQGEELTYKAIVDVEKHSCTWNESINEREVVVLGNY